MNIFIIRHGESQANVNRQIYKEVPDRMIELTEKGIKQAKKTGSFLKENFNINPTNTLFFSSSHRRAVQTSEHINLSGDLNCPIIFDDRIIEHNHGLFEGLNKKERFKICPAEAERYYNQKKLGNEYFTPIPMGESPFNVAVRFKNFWLEINNLIHPLIKNVIIVAHGMTNLVIWRELMNYSVDWYSKQENLRNGSIIHLELNLNKGLIEDNGIIYIP